MSRLGYLAAAVAGAAVALLAVRSCEGPAPVVDAMELQRIETERARLAADVAREHAAIEERARELAGLELYERIEELVPPARDAPRPAARARAAEIAEPEHVAAPPDRCHPTGDGWARCPEPVLERITLRLIAAESDRDSVRLDLDAERAYRRLDAEAWAVEREGYVRALDTAKPPAPWRLPAAVVSGAAIATGIALAVTGSEGAGLAVGGAGLVVGIAAVAF